MIYIKEKRKDKREILVRVYKYGGTEYICAGIYCCIYRTPKL